MNFSHAAISSISEIVSVMNKNFLDDKDSMNSKYVFRAFVTGVFGLQTAGYQRTGILRDRTFLRWRCNHTLSYFYGLSHTDVSNLLLRLLPPPEVDTWQFRHCVRFINKFYKIDIPTHALFSWSTIHFLKKKYKSFVPQFKKDYLKRFLPILKIREISRDVIQMIGNIPLRILIAKKTLCIEDIEILKQMVFSDDVTGVQKNVFYYFLHEHGYVVKSRFGCLIVPTNEIKSVFVKVMNI